MKTVKVKNTKIKLVVPLLIGIAVLAAGLLFLFIMYRPFVPWKEIWHEEDLWKTGEVGTYYVDWVNGDLTKSIIHYFYEIDGINYEKTYVASVSSHTYGPSRTFAVIYVSRNNPLETKPGSQGGTELLIFFIGTIIVGIIIILLALRPIIAKINKEKMKKSKEAIKHKK